MRFCFTGDMPLTGQYEPSSSRWAREHVAEYERTGRVGQSPEDRPIVVFTSVGARSGKLRKTPVMRVEHDGAYALVASKGGAPEHPVWYHNLKADPRVELQDGMDHLDLTARELTGAERELWWPRCVDAYPPYAEYQTKTDRVIPVFLLEPVAWPG